MGKVTWDGGVLALGLLEFGKLELRLDPQRQRSNVVLGEVRRSNVEVGASNTPQRRVEAEEPRECLEHGRFAGAVGPEQKDHGLERDGRRPLPEGLEVAQPQPC